MEPTTWGSTMNECLGKSMCDSGETQIPTDENSDKAYFDNFKKDVYQKASFKILSLKMKQQ